LVKDARFDILTQAIEGLARLVDGLGRTLLMEFAAQGNAKAVNNLISCLQLA